MSNNNKIIIVGFWPDYEEFSFQEVVIEGYDIEILNPKKTFENNSWFKHLPRFTKNFLYRHLIEKNVRKYPDAVYIFQEFRVCIDFLLERPKTIKACILLRKPISSGSKTVETIQKLKAKKYPVWSFDQQDCDAYKLDYYHQFIRAYPNAGSITPKYDFVFVGTDKGRASYLHALQNKLQNLGFSTKLTIIEDHKNSLISYPNYLKKLCNARCIIDIMQEGQSGMTLRPLEAILYKRKLLTTNATLKESDFYHQSNIYIIDKSIDLSDIYSFMKRPLTPLSSTIKEKFSTQKNVERFIQSFDIEQPRTLAKSL